MKFTTIILQKEKENLLQYLIIFSHFLKRISIFADQKFSKEIFFWIENKKLLKIIFTNLFI